MNPALSTSECHFMYFSWRYLSQVHGFLAKELLTANPLGSSAKSRKNRERTMLEHHSFGSSFGQPTSKRLLRNLWEFVMRTNKFMILLNPRGLVNIRKLGESHKLSRILNSPVGTFISIHDFHSV